MKWNGRRMDNHLLYEDIEKYFDLADVSDEYLCWFADKQEHIDTCEVCQQMLGRQLKLRSFFDENNDWELTKAMADIPKEYNIRTQLVAEKLRGMFSALIYEQPDQGQLLSQFSGKTRGRLLMTGDEINKPVGFFFDRTAKDVLEVYFEEESHMGISLSNPGVVAVLETADGNMYESKIRFSESAKRYKAKFKNIKEMIYFKLYLLDSKEK